MKNNARHSTRKRENSFKELLVEHLNANLRDYLILSITFIIGVMVGVIFINNLDEQSRNEINGYINSFLETIKNKEYQIDTPRLVRISILENLKWIAIIWFAGSTIIGIPVVYVIIAYKGFSIGYTISSIIITMGAKQGALFALTSLFGQNVIIIPIILMAGVSALKLYRSLVKENSRNTSVCKGGSFKTYNIVYIASNTTNGSFID